MAGAILLVSALIFGALAGGLWSSGSTRIRPLRASRIATGETESADTKTKPPNDGNQDTQEPTSRKTRTLDIPLSGLYDPAR